MSGIQGKNTKPETTIRFGLHRLGFRYRLHSPNLPGKPDMVFGRCRAVILIHGCFWHWHHCHLFKMPSTRQEFWKQKIGRNKERDAETILELNIQGWRVLTVWECALKGKTRLPEGRVIDLAAEWLLNGTENLEIEGKTISASTD